jgi:transposase
VDEAGSYLLPEIVKTYAPRGKTPVLHENQNRDHLSVMGAVTPEGKVYSLVRQKPLNGFHVIDFLDHLLCLDGDRLLVIWDGSPIHRRAAVREFLTKFGNRIHLEVLLFYALDLNPVEWMWRHLKQVELHNLVCPDLEALHMEFHLAFGRLRQKPQLIRSFSERAGLTL